MLLKQPKSAARRADIIGLDAQARPVLLVEVKAALYLDASLARAQLGTYLRALLPEIVPFGMAVDSREIQVYRWDGNALSEPIARLGAADIFTHYDSEFSRKNVFEPYLAALIEAWLRDTAYHWKSENPPGFSILSKFNLTDLLAGGTTVAEASLYSWDTLPA